MGEFEGYKSVKDLLTQGETLIKNGYKDYLEAKIDENVMNVLLFTKI